LVAVPLATSALAMRLSESSVSSRTARAELLMLRRPHELLIDAREADRQDGNDQQLLVAGILW